MTNLADNLTAAARSRPDQVALRLDATDISYTQLDDLTARVAGLLTGRGFEPGDRAGVMLPNVPYFAIAYYGILRAGGIVVPMNVLLKARETGFYLSDPQAKLIFAWHDFADAAEAGATQAGAECIIVAPGEFDSLLADTRPVSHVVNREDDATAVVLYTSGTTGTPKGAELTHANLAANASSVVDMLGLTTDDVILGALPLFHAFGQTCGLNAAVAATATLTLIPRFDPQEAGQIIARDQVTVFEGVPTMYSALLHQASDTNTASLRVCISGGSALPVEVLRTFEDTFACKVLEGYGLSETSPVASFNHPDRDRKPGSIGTPVRGVEMKLVDDNGDDTEPGGIGEIVIRGHNVMKGYWNRPDATDDTIDPNGWFHTGDMATIDDDGYFFIVDRKKDLIIRGGYNVYPREIEEVLYEHPAVREAAVLGITHPELGEEVGAAVALKPDADATAEELQAHVKTNVAAYKYPRQLWIVDDLPKGPTGKILKREIPIPDQATGPA